MSVNRVSYPKQQLPISLGKRPSSTSWTMAKEQHMD